MRTLVAGLLMILTARHASAGALVASMTADTLFVHRVMNDKLDKVFEEKGKGAYAYAWIDATLWVLRKDKTGVTLGKVVDGKADPAVKLIAGLEVATPSNEVPDGIDVAPGLAATKSGQIYVTSCIGEEPNPAQPNTLRCKLAYYRADDGSLAKVAKRPRDVVFQFGEPRVPRMPPLKRPPKGYGVAITKVKLKAGKYVGYACTGPSGKKSWPTEADASDMMEPIFTPKVNKATWFATTPPIVHIEANGKSPVGEKLYQDWYLVGCTTEVSSVRPLRDGLWMTDDEVRRPSGEVIGKLPGGEVVVAP